MDEGGVAQGQLLDALQAQVMSARAPRLNRFAAVPGGGSPLVPVTARFPAELSARPRRSVRRIAEMPANLPDPSLRQRGAGRFAFTLLCWLTSVSVG